MLNSSDILRGYTDTIILAQLVRGDSYGYVISKNVQEITGGAMQMKEATLYTTFRRLESAGMIESYWGNENAGARRRYYHLTDTGRALYEENRKDWHRYCAMISGLIETDIQANDTIMGMDAEIEAGIDAEIDAEMEDETR